MLLEQQIYDNLKDSLKDIEGTVAIAINNHMGYKTVEEVIHISYTAKDINITYYTSGNEIKTIKK